MFYRLRHIATLTLCIALAAPLAAHRDRSSAQVPMVFDDGELEVSIRPDGQQPLRLHRTADGEWRFEGSTASLVGVPYSVVLRNRSDRRLKVVVGVDGVNVYRKTPLSGTASSDIGSVLGPWSTREIPGWQLDEQHAQRFLFSPTDWSEGQGLTDPQIGTLRVELYVEARPEPIDDYRRGRGYSRHEDSREQRRIEEREGAGDGELRPSAKPDTGTRHSEPRRERIAQDQATAIGTSSGDDVAHRVRTVHFRPTSHYPVSRLRIDYGHASPPPPRPHFDELGLELRDTYRGSRVVRIEPGSSAARAGLRTGDIILRIDTAAQPTARVVRRIWRQKGRGQHVFLRVRREGVDLALKARS